MAWIAFSYTDHPDVKQRIPLYLHPRYRGLVIRLTSKDLADWIDRAREMYKHTGADFTGSPTQIKFPSGATIRTGHLNDENAYNQYLGHEYQKQLIEELTQIPSETSYEKLISACRSTIPEIKPQIFATTNPGNVGHAWVKKRWQIPDSPTSENIVTATPFGGRAFIHATVYDNERLNEVDPNYRLQLEAISDENLKQAWLFGGWGNPIIPGAIYKEEVDNAYATGRIGRVPHDPRYPVHTYWDIGVGDSTSIGFFQYRGGNWLWIDYYEESGKGLSHYRDILTQRGYFYGQHFGPHDLAQRQMGVLAERIVDIAEQLGIIFTILPKRPVNQGIITVKEKFHILHIDEEKCQKAIYALRNYRREYDEDAKKYKDNPVHDWTSHCADMVRYWAEAPDPVLPGQLNEDFNLYSHSYK